MQTITPYDYPNLTLYFDEDLQPCSMESVGLFKKTYAPVLFSLMFVWGLLGNVLVIVTFNHYKRAKSMTDVYLLNMAVADILLVLTLPFWAVYHHKQEWIFQDFMCKLVRALYAINFSCSMLLLACVSIDRYVAIVQVTKSFKFRTTAMAYKNMICLFVWLFSALLSSFTYYFSESYEINSVLVCEPRYYGASTALQLKLAALAVQVAVGYFIPFLVMLFCYTCIIKTLLHAQNSQRHKAIRVIVVVVAVFLFCQVPYNVLLLKKAIEIGNPDHRCHEHVKSAYALFLTETLAFGHCCLNPSIYAFIGVKFRNYFWKIIQDLWCVSKQYMTGTRSSRMSSDMYVSKRTSEGFPSDGGSSFTM
ncbi:C-C chemokine receptor type 6 [Spea bombifrons]|uniref:C-C chemokine receptor type 6 n=1 Tax=Spea bombifrons TaxID=233779 RepID=UPI00234BBD98|nr:C-C chemokine receptor type 6 [Spea bombifrons]